MGVSRTSWGERKARRLRQQDFKAMQYVILIYASEAAFSKFTPEQQANYERVL